MSIQSVAYVLGWVLRLEALFLLLPILCGVLYGESQLIAYLVTAALCALASLPLAGIRRKNVEFFAREGFVATSLSWIVLSIFAALPFKMTGEIPRYIDALFETVSGFTTTGASILPDVESMSHCSMLWRCFTHWIGGMGVLVFLLAVIPMVGGSNMHLMKAESPGPSVGKLVPKVRHTARILYLLYIALTALQFVLLLLGGMIPFEALCTAFGTAGTGGFGFRNDSFASFSPYIQWVVTIFMIVFGVNFNVYYLILLRRVREALCCEEMRWYLAIITAATLLICANIYDAALSLEANLRAAAFQVASIISSTGYATMDFDLWPTFSKILLIALMFVGACAGSTGGGMKVSRIVIAFKTFLRQMSLSLHPRRVSRVRFEGRDVEEDTVRTVSLYFAAVAFLVVGSVFLLSLDGLDPVSTFTAAVTTFNNIGPGLATVGPSCNFSHLSDLSKIVLIFNMLTGRLEIFPVLMLFYPPLWHETVSRLRRERRLEDNSYRSN